MSLALNYMKLIIAVLIVLLPMNALASWRLFARVTPATQRDYELLVEVRPLREKTGIYGIRLPANSESQYLKSAWLIVTKLPLSEASQDFSRMQGSRKIVVKSKLQIQPVAAWRRSESEAKFYYLELSQKIMERAYIYIDFDLGPVGNQYVNDGGYYYTVDLSTFVWSKRPSANKCIANKCMTSTHTHTHTNTEPVN